MNKKLTRRQLLLGMGISTTGLFLVACQPREVLKEVTKLVEVEKEKVVEKQVTQVVKETVVVQGTPQVVTKVVEKAVTAQGGAIQPRGFGAWGGGRLLPPPKKYSPTLKITQGFQVFALSSPADTDKDNDNIFLRWIRDQTGVWYEKLGGGREKMNAAVAAGDLPDAFNWVGGLDYDRMVKAKLLEDIKPIWDTVASPLVKQKKQYPNHFIWNPAIQDGKMYGVPWCEDEVGAGDQMMYIRKDWLDKVGLPVPKTLDELKAAGLAFKKAGLAQWGICANNALINWIASLDTVFGAYGTMPKRWHKDDKGGLVYGSIMPQVVEPLKVLQDWYKSEFLPKELPTVTYGREEIMSGKVGIWSLPYWGYNWVKDLYRNDPKANVVHIHGGPTGPGGRYGRVAQVLGPSFCCFRKGIEPEKLEAIFNHLNWVYQRWETCVENTDGLFMGMVHDPVNFEGYDYTWKDGKVAPGPTTTLHWGSLCDHPMEFNPTVTTDMFARMDKVIAKKQEDKNPIEVFITSDLLTVNNRYAHKSLVETKQFAFKDMADGLIPPPDSVKEKWGDLIKLESTTYLKFITGETPLTDFDKFVADWKKLGGDQVTADVSAWYAAQKK